jgi:arylsulfatase A-like enzyme
MGSKRQVYLLAACLCLLTVGGVLYLYSCRGAGEPEIAPARPQEEDVWAAVKGANLVIVVMDAARADHVGCYGYPRQTTPNIDRLSRESVVFTNHHCQSPHTPISTMSLFTSQYPDTHPLQGRRRYEPPEFTMRLGLQEAGFRTGFFSSNMMASPAFHIGGDYEEVYAPPELERFTRRGEQRIYPEPLLRAFSGWLDKCRGERFFAYLHLLPPHRPYVARDATGVMFSGEPPGFEPGDYGLSRCEFAEVREFLAGHPPQPEPPPLPKWINLYDANLQYADWAVGQVERLLTDAGIIEDTLLVVTADHGEAFGEHGYIWHSTAIHDEVSHIPLLMRMPGGRLLAGRYDALTQTIDLLPTVFELFDITYPEEEVQGRSLVPLLTGTAEAGDDCTVIRSKGPPKYMIRNQRYALVLYESPECRALYDLECDPGQKCNVIEDCREEAEVLLEAFDAYAAAQERSPTGFLEGGDARETEPEAAPEGMSPELQKELRALGYLK